MGSDGSQGAAAPGWYQDPVGRHDQRYWDGMSWTQRVATGGQQSVDPLAGAPDSAVQSSGSQVPAKTKPARRWAKALGAILTALTVYLLIGGSLVVILTPVLVYRIADNVERKATVAVYLADEANDTDRAALRQSIRSDPNVASVSYVSKEEALARFREDMKDNPEVLDKLEGNPLPASFEIALRDPRQVEALVAKIKADPSFLRVADRPDNPDESIKYGQQVVERLFSLLRVVRVVGSVMIVPVVLVCGVLATIFLMMVPSNRRVRLVVWSAAVALGLIAVSGLVLYVQVSRALPFLMR